MSGQAFFANSNWENIIRPEYLGISALRIRLSALLEDHTRALLPAVIPSITELSTNCRQELERLGPARETSSQQRLYLVEISDQFRTLVVQAVQGSYVDGYSSAGNDTRVKHLQATIQNTNDSFAQLMVEKGHVMEFRYDSVARSCNPPLPSLDAPETFTTLPQSIIGTYHDAMGKPLVAANDPHLYAIEVQIRATRGRELPTMFNTNLVGPVFREQSSK